MSCRSGRALTKEARPQNGSKKTGAAIERMEKERMDNEEGTTRRAPLTPAKGNGAPPRGSAVVCE